ncbi:MAG: hypothetical protein ABMB14_05290 [Myxococcota bacterium]
MSSPTATSAPLLNPSSTVSSTTTAFGAAYSDSSAWRVRSRFARYSHTSSPVSASRASAWSSMLVTITRRPSGVIVGATSTGALPSCFHRRVPSSS